jgi:uncharacterized membrane protein YraQ (UPF0718 family)
MLMPTIIMGIIAIVLVFTGYLKGGEMHINGLQSAWTTTIQILPLLIFSFIIAGMIQVLIPAETVSKLVGEKSGFKGILIGSIAGILTPGGPYISLPILAGFQKSGASIPVMVSYLTGWSLLSIARIPMEIGILGLKFTIIKTIAVIVFPVLAGLLAKFL